MAIDRFGNVAALTHSINTMIWGTTGIFVQGVSIPDSANFQQNRLAAAGPGGRIPNEMNPVIVRRDDETILASSCIGVALHEASLQALVNVLDRGMNPKQAVEAPMFLGLNWVGADGDPDAWRRQVVPAWPFEEALLDEVEALGQPLHRIEPAALASHNGFWIGITREPKSGGLAGGVGPELNGHALAK